MNSRQRVIAAINHRPVDRVPIDLNPTLTAYENLKAHLGLEIPESVTPNLAVEVIPHPEVLSRLGVDLISVKLPDPGRASESLPEKRVDMWGLEYRLVRQRQGAYYENVTHPLAGSTTADLQDYPWPDSRPGAVADALHDHARRLYDETDLALVGRFGPPILETAMFLVGMEEWYVRLATDQQFIRVLLEKISAIATGCDAAGIEASGEYVQIVKVSGEDLGMQNGLLFSPKVIRELLLPPLRRRWGAVCECLDRVNPSAKIMLHSCGAIRAFIPQLIEAGIDVLDPVQPMARGMEPAGLKADFGDRLVFHGGIDVQHLLPRGTPEEIARQVRQCLNDFQAHRGGYILAPSHNVQADVPPENLLAMIESAKNWKPLQVRPHVRPERHQVSPL